MDTSKNQQAVQIIANKIKSIPANTPMDHGTFGSTLGVTKREGEAHSMALYFVKAMGGKITFEIEKSEEEKEAQKSLQEIVAAAIAIVGK